MLDVPVQRPAGFDLATWWAGSRAEYEAMLPTFRALVRVAPAVLERTRWGWRFGRIEEELPADADGWIPCRLRFDTIEVALDAVVGLGPDAEVLEPDELRKRVDGVLRRLVARYA
jgi:predicted DNA-binding transcriptional regulator YafY